GPSQGGGSFPAGGGSNASGGVFPSGSSYAPSGFTAVPSDDQSASDPAALPSGMNGYRQEEAKIYEQYSVAEQQVLSVTPQETMSVTISVDELDILSLRESLSAEITLEALKGQSFTGTVTALGRTGTNEGGNTKFSVTVSLPRQQNLLAGMNASVKITTAQTEAAAAIPVNALVEEGSRTYVYTSYNESTDTLGGLTEVETGISDGITVEIRSGLSSGSTVWYRYADSMTYPFFSR
ncbi:MAG: efflux RND transporter periplasmic adaptor subunit, partial [Oscillospiraceae bacterium]|nr:efflux RND transporter periplasmic adaptor subunit [Oscillospiraceae bacterium]